MRPSGVAPGQQLTTGPIRWDEQALQQARERMPNAQLLNAMLMLAPFPGMGAAGGLMRALRSPLLRDMRLEWMFRK